MCFQDAAPTELKPLAAVDTTILRDHCAKRHDEVGIVKAKRVSIVVLVVAGGLGAYWVADEERKSARRLNAPSHLKQVGLSFRQERNDLGLFTLSGEVQKQAESAAAKQDPAGALRKAPSGLIGG